MTEAALTRQAELAAIVDDLRDVYTERGIQIWLNARNRNLAGGVPVELLAAGGGAAVRAEVDRVTGGM